VQQLFNRIFATIRIETHSPMVSFAVLPIPSL
jgi:hypothetical protein